MRFTTGQLQFKFCDYKILQSSGRQSSGRRSSGPARERRWSCCDHLVAGHLVAGHLVADPVLGVVVFLVKLEVVHWYLLQVKVPLQQMKWLASCFRTWQIR